MKLNLAALPKEEAWRIWARGYYASSVSMAMWTEAGQPEIGGVCMVEIHDNARTAFETPLQPNSVSRALFELWWFEQISQR